MDKYSRGKIYLIRNRVNESLIYVGSTIERYLSKRFQKHKSHKGCSLYEYINNPDNNTNWDEWYIELYEEFPCENKLQLCKKENEIIREKSTINKKGYLTEEIKKENDKKYRENNKEYYKEYREKYRENNKEYYKEYCKEYCKNNKDKKKEYDKEYRENNSEIIICECKCKIKKNNLSKHKKSKKHIEFLNNIPS